MPRSKLLNNDNTSLMKTLPQKAMGLIGAQVEQRSAEEAFSDYLSSHLDFLESLTLQP